MKQIILALFLLPLMSICAQTTTSSNVRYDIGEAHDMLVRTIDNHRIVAHSATGAYTHNFIVSELNFGSSNAFSCNLGQLFSLPDDHYVVKDMCVYDGNCYFCGVMHRATGSPILDEFGNIIGFPSDHQGFIGFFKIASVASGNASLCLRLIAQTDSLTRLVAYDPEANSIRTQIAAIGAGGDDNYEEIPPRTPLLLEISEVSYPGQPAYWEHSLMKVSPGEHPGEYFHDICVTKNLLRIVSGLECETMQWPETSKRYVIHTVKRPGFYYQYFNYFSIPYTEQASYFSQMTDRHSNSSVYFNESHMRMCPIDGDSCCLAYGSFFNTTGAGQYSLLKLDETNQIAWAKIIFNYQYPYLLDIDYSPSDHTLALLGADSNATNGTLFLTTLAGPSSSIYNKIHWNDGKLESLTMYDHSKLALGATSSNNRVYHLLQNINSYSDQTHNCLETDENDILSAMIHQPINQDFNWVLIQHQPWLWGASRATSQAISTTITCLRQ